MDKVPGFSPSLQREQLNSLEGVRGNKLGCVGQAKEDLQTSVLEGCGFDGKGYHLAQRMYSKHLQMGRLIEG